MLGNMVTEVPRSPRPGRGGAISVAIIIRVWVNKHSLNKAGLKRGGGEKYNKKWFSFKYGSKIKVFHDFKQIFDKVMAYIFSLSKNFLQSMTCFFFLEKNE
jgi:hypothetical protein